MRGAVANALVLHGIADDADREAVTAESERLAREALALDSGSAQAYLVLAGAARQRRRWPACQQYARTAARLAPQHPAFVATAGFLIEVSGEWEEGMALLEEAYLLDPRLPAYVRLYLAMGNVVLGDYELALAEAMVIDVEGEIWGPFYRAMALAGLGDLPAAHREIAQLLAIQPGFFDAAEPLWLDDFRFTDEQRSRIMRLLDEARRGPE